MMSTFGIRVFLVLSLALIAVSSTLASERSRDLANVRVAAVPKVVAAGTGGKDVAQSQLAPSPDSASPSASTGLPLGCACFCCLGDLNCTAEYVGTVRQDCRDPSQCSLTVCLNSFSDQCELGNGTISNQCIAEPPAETAPVASAPVMPMGPPAIPVTPHPASDPPPSPPPSILSPTLLPPFNAANGLGFTLLMLASSLALGALFAL